MNVTKRKPKKKMERVTIAGKFGTGVPGEV